MTGFYDRIAKRDSGARALSMARLKHQVLKLLHAALRRCAMSQVDLANRLGVRKSAVNQVLRGDGNVRIATLADYLHAMGFEAELTLVPVGKPREDATRAMNIQRVQRLSSTASSARRELVDVEWRRSASDSEWRVTAS